VTKHHEAISNEHVPHGLPGSLPSLLSNDDLGDDYKHVSMKHTSSSLAELLVDLW
jgi:hypothetical protein